MNVTVTPDEFKFVTFDAELIRQVGEGIVAMLGIDRPVRIEVDETTPLGRMRADIGDTIVLHIESGAFEDTRRPRQQSETTTALALGRILLRVRDRLHGGFAEAPPDDELALRQMAAWESYCAGRLIRLGLVVHQQRWRYNFRNRHGFTDAADAAFDRLWASEHLTWGELDAISSEAAAASTVA